MHGIDEGCQFSSYFDFDYYRANNKDLANLDNNELLQHFEIHGMDEGSKSSSSFNAFSSVNSWAIVED